MRNVPLPLKLVYPGDEDILFWMLNYSAAYRFRIHAVACKISVTIVLLYKFFSINNYYITSFTKNNQWLSWYHVMQYFTHWTTDYIHILLENNSKLTAIIYKKIMSSSKSFQLMFNYFQNTFSKYFPLQHVQPQIVATGSIDQNIGKVHSLLRLPNCI